MLERDEKPFIVKTREIRKHLYLVSSVRLPFVFCIRVVVFLFLAKNN